MEFLNKNATIVFAKLIDFLNGGQHRTIVNKPYMQLTIEHIGKYIETPWGLANLYSLSHYYEQNGDLMRDPEMCFFVIDNRNGFPADYQNVKVAPYMFQQDSLELYQESVHMENSKLTVFNRKMQQDHTVFANQWLKNIQQQGFLNQ